MFDQLLILFGLGAILRVGVRMTAMQTNTLRYILLMKKGQLYDAQCRKLLQKHSNQDYHYDSM